MKKFFLIGIPVILILSACSKSFLNREPTNAYSASSLFTDSSDVIAAINGCYNGWENPFTDSGPSWADELNVQYMDCISDNAYSQFPWEGFQAHGNGYSTATDGNEESLWNYVTIQKCNWFLQNVVNAPVDTTLKLRTEGEARFIRAYEYFVMSQLYGDVPLVTAPITTAQANSETRTPKADVTKFILSELGDIAPNLPLSYSGSDVGRITRGAALALKARVELYEQDYADCITDCQQIMNSGVYQLFPSYSGLFRIQNEDNSEVILDIQYMENSQPNGGLGVMLPSSDGGWSSIDPTQSLVDSYEMLNGKSITDPTSGYDPSHPFANRDPRLAATIIYPGELYPTANNTPVYYDPIDPSSSDYYSGNNNSRTGYEVKKFTSNLSDFDNIWNTGLNMILIRYAEVLLNYAEAENESVGPDVSVYSAIDQVRERAGMPDIPLGLSQDSMRQVIRLERRVEFAMEGLRWYDIQRWKIGPQVMAGTVYGTRLGTVDPTTGATTFTGNNVVVENRVFDPNKNYLWPIPQSEIDINKNLQQNPGY
jgi:starch-binding outer membrane protein, SusD/RagB family